MIVTLGRHVLRMHSFNRAGIQLKALSVGQSNYSEQLPQTGIVMLNMGGPAKLDDVHNFLLRLFSDTDIIKLPVQHRLGPWIARRRTPSIQSKYAEIGGGSPIHYWTHKQGQLMCDRLDQISPQTAPHHHFIAFRYTAPDCEEALDDIDRSQVRRLVLFSQYPQYSCATTGSSINDLYRQWSQKPAAQLLPHVKEIRVVDRWCLQPQFLQCHVHLLSKQLLQLTDVQLRSTVILFSAHSLPMAAVSRGDPYPAEVAATVHAVMHQLQQQWANSGRATPLPAYRLVWQSKVGPSKWLEPATDAVIESLARRGHKHLVLVPISFVNEHIETLHELDIEYGTELAEKVGVTVHRVPAPNDHALFIDALAQLVVDRLQSSERVASQLLMPCPMCTNNTCYPAKRWLRELTTRST